MKKKLLFCIFILFFPPLLTFPQAYQWAKGIGSYGQPGEGGTDIITDISGNVYITGSFINTVDFDPGIGISNLTSIAYSDIFFAKYDSLGNYIWAKSIGSVDGDVSWSIAIDSSSNIYITGYAYGSLDFDPGPGIAILSGGIFFAKYDSLGNYIWAKRISVSGGIFSGNSIKVDKFGNILITGFFSNTSDFDPGTGVINLTSNYSTDIFIAKYDSLGNYVWAKNIGGGNDYGNDIAVDENGNVYVTGFFQGPADFDTDTGIAILSGFGGKDIFIAKYDGYGNYIWAKPIGGSPGEDIGNSISVGVSGNIFLTGSFEGTVDFDPGIDTFNLFSIGNSDVFFAKYDELGNYIWAHNIGSNGDNIGKKIKVDESDNIFIMGHSSGTMDFDPGIGTVNINKDIFFAKYDNLGNYLWASGISSWSSDGGKSLHIDNLGNIYITGNFFSTMDCDPGPNIANISSNGWSDVFFAKYFDCKNNLDINISVGMNNPTCYGNNDGSIYLSTSGGQSPYLYYWDSFGADSLGLDSFLINIAAGSYFVTVTDSKGCYKVQTASLLQPNPIITISTTISNVICNGDSNGVINISASGGNGIYDYSIDNGDNFEFSNIFDSLTVGTYQVAVRDSNNCYAYSQSIIINEPSQIIIDILNYNTTCSGSNNGSVVTSVTGGTGNIHYLWSAGDTTSNISNLPVGNYLLTVSDSMGCFEDTAIDIFSNNSAAWIKKSDFGGITRYGAIGFSIGTKGYIGTGKTGSGSYDFWEYEPSLNVWTQKANFAGGARYGAFGFSIGNKGYIGAGYYTGGFSPYYKNDFYEYNPSTNTWSSKANFGGTAREAAVGFSIGNKGYAGLGGNNGTGVISKDWWEYDPSTNLWTQKANFGGTARIGAVGFSIGTKGYVGTGYDYIAPYKNDFWEYNPATNTWIQKADFGGTPRYAAFGFSIDSMGYIGTGYDSIGPYKKDVWQYNSSTNAWTKKSDFVGFERSFSVGFAIANKGYVGTGGIYSGTWTYLKDFWEYDPSQDLMMLSVTNSNLQCYCNDTATAIASGGVFSYLWGNGATDSIITGLCDGIYYVTVTDSSTCTKIDSVNIFGQSSINSTTVSSSICLGDSIFIQGNFQNTAGTYFDTLQTVNGCDSIIQTMLTVNPNTASSSFYIYPDSIPHNWFAVNTASGIPPLIYYWSWGDGDTSVGVTPSHTYSDSGYFNICLTVVDSTGCSDTYCDSSTYINKKENAIITINVILQPTVIQENLNDVPAIKIIPNPSNGKFLLHTDNLQSSKIKIYNVIGEIIFQSSGKNLEIDLSKHPKGIYSIEIITQDKSFNKKLIIQ